jgi:predicted nucleic acid-binding protein
MILTPDNEYSVVPDACVLMPMPLCDTFLRAAEEPAFFRIAWSEQILDEVRRGLQRPNFGYSETQVDRRMRAMRGAFPDALVTFAPQLVEGIIGIPDPNDRHVVAAALQARADSIVTSNLRDFPPEVLATFGLTVLSADDFLVHQYHLGPSTMLEKLDRQAAVIKQQRSELLRMLRPWAPIFSELCSQKP